MKRNILIILAAFLGCSLYAQNNPNAVITVTGAVDKPLTLSQADLGQMDTENVGVSDQNDQMHTFVGVRLIDILAKAGVPVGDDLHGANMAKYVLVTAKDGYKVVYSLPELDPTFTNQVFVLAFEKDGQPLSADAGPFQMVVSQDMKDTRWIRQVIDIKVMVAQ